MLVVHFCNWPDLSQILTLQLAKNTVSFVLIHNANFVYRLLCSNNQRLSQRPNEALPKFHNLFRIIVVFWNKNFEIIKVRPSNAFWKIWHPPSNVFFFFSLQKTNYPPLKIIGIYKKNLHLVLDFAFWNEHECTNYMHLYFPMTVFFCYGINWSLIVMITFLVVFLTI